MLLSLLILLGALVVGSYVYMQQPKFGQRPVGADLIRISQSPNYVNGAFQNQLPIPPSDNEENMATILIKYLFTKKERAIPSVPIPSAKTNLLTLDANQDVVIWLGHSSYYLQLAGKRILIDPVFSINASPVPFTNQAFAGTSLYTVEEMPDIDYLLLSHDHWDHLDYPTIIALKDNVKRVITGLGVGSSFKRWGYNPDLIYEGDWNQSLQLDDKLTVHFLPARHFSGRGFIRNSTLWVSFALITDGQKLFFSGDSGYGPHFAEIGRQFNGFDLAILDSGQYDHGWRYVHMMPEDSAQAAEDLHARALLPAHTGKFSLAYHAWNDPFIRAVKASENKSYHLLTPMIGEPIWLNNKTQTFHHWWEKIANL
nr:MBL fold metallo-hydrolase [Limnobaculum sp. M2-1]